MDIEVKDSDGVLLATVPASNVKISSDNFILNIKPNLSESSDFVDNVLSIKQKTDSAFPITSLPKDDGGDND